jgi:Putative cyclase
MSSAEPQVQAPGDQLGMLKHVDETKRLEALRLVKTGRLYELGHVLDERVPVFPGRYFRQTLVTTAHHANGGGIGDNQVNWITEVFTGTTQLGTHVDALSHLQIGDRAYNGWTVGELAGPSGVTQLGAETIPQIVTRGWLVDVSDKNLGPGGQGVRRLLVLGPSLDLPALERPPGSAPPHQEGLRSNGVRGA